jgi:hypothetical protein
LLAKQQIKASARAYNRILSFVVEPNVCAGKVVFMVFVLINIYKYKVLD